MVNISNLPPRKDLVDATILTVRSQEPGSRLDIKLGRKRPAGDFSDEDAIVLEVMIVIARI